MGQVLCAKKSKGNLHFVAYGWCNLLDICVSLCQASIFTHRLYVNVGTEKLLLTDVELGRAVQLEGSQLQETKGSLTRFDISSCPNIFSGPSPASSMPDAD